MVEVICPTFFSTELGPVSLVQVNLTKKSSCLKALPLICIATDNVPSDGMVCGEMLNVQYSIAPTLFGFMKLKESTIKRKRIEKLILTNINLNFERRGLLCFIGS